MKMLLTRLGHNSKIVVTGDVEQADRHGANNGLLDLEARITSLPINEISLCKFNNKDIQRHHLIGDVLELYHEV